MATLDTMSVVDTITADVKPACLYRFSLTTKHKVSLFLKLNAHKGRKGLRRAFRFARSLRSNEVKRQAFPKCPVRVLCFTFMENWY